MSVVLYINDMHAYTTLHKYEKHFPKMYKDVGMAVPKTTQTRYMDGSVQRTTQVTPSLHLFFIFVFHTKMFPVISQQSLDTRSIQKKDVGMGLLV